LRLAQHRGNQPRATLDGPAVASIEVGCEEKALPALYALALVAEGSEA
jgi:hypothetical protein